MIALQLDVENWRIHVAITLPSLFSYCVTFELTKVSKACHKEKVFNSLADGN